MADKWEASYVTNMDLAKLELAKSHLYVALHSAAEQWHEEPMSDAVQLCLKPMGLRAKKDFKAQELCLYPMPFDNRLSRDQALADSDSRAQHV